MKGTAISISALGIAVVAVIQVQAQSFPTNGLIAYYPLAGNPNDASGNGNNGVAFAVTPAMDQVGNPQGAYQFNGSNSVVTVASLSSTNLNELTLAAWIKLQSAQPTQWDILSKWRAYSYSLEDYDLSIQNMQALFGNGRHGTGYNALPNHCAIVSTNQLLPGRWYHIVATLDSAGTGKLWVNGVLSAQDYILQLLPPASEPVRIGQMLYNTGAIVDSFNGMIDQVFIYNRAISDSEVTQLYNLVPCAPRRATATAQMTNGLVIGATVIDGGCGYANTPLVLIQGGGGTGATATAVVNNGVVTGIVITAAGTGYTSAPIIYIYSPLGVQTGLMKAVKPTFSDLLVGTNYQLQVSADFQTWSNQGSPFTATGPTMVYPQYWDVDNWSQLFFRVQVAP